MFGYKEFSMKDLEWIFPYRCSTCSEGQSCQGRQPRLSYYKRDVPVRQVIKCMETRTIAIPGSASFFQYVHLQIPGDEIEIGKRFIKEHDLRVPCNILGDEYFLLLSSRENSYGSLSQFFYPHHAEGPFHGLVIFCRRSPEKTHFSIPAHQDHFFYRKRGEGIKAEVLDHVPNPFPYFMPLFLTSSPHTVA